jgi:hypothetical protein
MLIALLITINSYADSLTDNSYKGVRVGSKESDALKLLKVYNIDDAGSEGNCHYLISKENEDDASFMVNEGLVSRIDIYGKSKITTKEGIKIGSNKSDVLAKYPKVEVSPHPYISPDGEYLKVKLSSGLGVIFETDHDVITSFRMGNDSISYIEGCE